MLDTELSLLLKQDSIKAVEKRRTKLEEDMDEFLANGGRIRELSPGESGLTLDSNSRKRNLNKLKTEPDYETIARSDALDKIAKLDLNNSQNVNTHEIEREERIRIAIQNVAKRKEQTQKVTQQILIEEKSSNIVTKKPSVNTKNPASTDQKINPKQAVKKVNSIEVERLENIERMRRLKQLKHEAIRLNQKFFQGPCRIHGTTTYGIFHNGTRCCLCKSKQRVSLTLKNTNNEYYMQDRIRREHNRGLMYLSIMQYSYEFIGCCKNCGDTKFKITIRRQTGRRHAYYYHCVICTENKLKISKEEKEIKRRRVAEQTNLSERTIPQLTDKLTSQLMMIHN